MYGQRSRSPAAASCPRHNKRVAMQHQKGTTVRCVAAGRLAHSRHTWRNTARRTLIWLGRPTRAGPGRRRASLLGSQQSLPELSASHVEPATSTLRCARMGASRNNFACGGNISVSDDVVEDFFGARKGNSSTSTAWRAPRLPDQNERSASRSVAAARTERRAPFSSTKRRRLSIAILLLSKRSELPQVGDDWRLVG